LAGVRTVVLSKPGVWVLVLVLALVLLVLTDVERSWRVRLSVEDRG
jgi:hypothetical protein